MNARERFLATLRFQRPDRIPFHDEEIRPETLQRWRKEGLPRGRNPTRIFQLEEWERVPVKVDRIPPFEGRIRSRQDFEALKRSYRPGEPSRYPTEWQSLVEGWRNRDYPLGITAWPGFFQPLNVSNAPTLRDVLRMIYLDPDLLEEMTQFIADFSIDTIDRALQDLEVDYAIIGEPIADNGGPLISPANFRRFLVPCYERIVSALRSRGVEVIILNAYGNVKGLISLCLKAGINCLWCRGTKLAGVDYVALRDTYGHALSLIGGIDVGCLAKDARAIDAEIGSKVPRLLSSGGYIPMVDNRVRENVPFGNYAHYRALIAGLARTASGP